MGKSIIYAMQFMANKYQKKIIWFLIIITTAGLSYLLNYIFSGRLILSQTFFLGPLTVHFYGLILAVAVGVGFYLAIKRAKNFDFNESWAENILFWTVIGGFIGARIYHVFSSFEFYQNNPVEVFKVWNGGLSIYGALLGGLFVIWLFADKILHLKSSILNLLDWLTPSLIVGQIIGRFGNLFNYEAYGYPTNLPWKMFVPLQFRPEDLVAAQFFHPLFLYEVLGNLAILFFLLWRRKKIPNPIPGGLFFSYLLLYNSLRFCLEFVRIDSTFIGNFRLNAIISLSFVGLALVWFLTTNYKCLKNIN